MTPRFVPAMLTFALLACGGKDETPTDTDTGTTPITTPTTFAGFADADLADQDTVRVLSMLSAEQLYFRAVFSLELATSTYDKACPVVEYVDSYHLTITGGCTDTEGVAWSGVFDYQIVGGLLTATFTDFGFTGFDFDCYGVAIDLNQRLDGTITYEEATLDLTLDLAGLQSWVDVRTCDVDDYDYILQYDMHVEQLKGGEVYSGTGRYADDVNGYVEMSTLSEVDDTCASEADSGSTILANESHEVVITYDGAVDCDDPGTATWTLDGAPQGEILGISCSSAPGAAGWLAFAPLLTLIRRRR